MKKIIPVAILFTFLAFPLRAELLEDSVLKAVAEEVSGETAKRNLEFFSRQHRMRGSKGYAAVADFIADQLRQYGLQNVKVEQFPADGKKFYGTQRSRRPWDAEYAELWEVQQTPEGMVRQSRLASWEAMPMSLAQDSESGEVTATLVDIGTGSSDQDYSGKQIRGNLVLTSQQPESIVRLAVDKYGASGIISYAQNQRTAWWGEDENMVRWGHVGSFNAKPAFAFMISLKQARALQKRLLAGEKIQLHAKVIAGQHEGSYHVVTATIPGADPQLMQQEIVFSCHLDHPRPGANDNASGCATILEVARTFAKLIAEKKIERPARTLRFVWPPEIEGTLAFLTARPEIKNRIKTAIHLDMVGGAPQTKAIFHITRGPASRPSFVHDIADYFGEFVNQQTQQFAGTGTAVFSLHAPEGNKEAFQADLAPFSMGSDHQIYAESSFGIPAIYFNDWPDRYIHTNFDHPGNIDPTKLKRAGFLAGVIAFYLANFTQKNIEGTWSVLKAAALDRMGEMIARSRRVTPDDSNQMAAFQTWYEQMVFDSINDYADIPGSIKQTAVQFYGDLMRLAGPPPQIKTSGSNLFWHGTLIFLGR